MKFKTEVYKGGLNIPVTTGLLTKILAFWKWNDKKYRTFKADDMASSNHHITATTFIPLTKELTAILSYTVERKYLPKVISGEIANEHMNMFNLTLVLNRGE